ncbi:hypothetical protein PH213_12800 [Streptomyces sp. SRF1]|uniref:hypothetical protein n=1 Tax=Streptomyces sp. SRF1 TaxID=1549642 RepID=UPI0025AF5A38|nr:hypothetical protein [Streptomyces sp. SRF1]MDN3055401.1 hypothetical protein [Streptomyces sp. SRF1]
MTAIDTTQGVGVSRLDAVSGFAARLRLLGVPNDSVADVLEVPADSAAYLTTDSRATLAAGRLLVTGDLNQYKQWIGRPDDECADVPLELPEPWTAGTGRDCRDLTAAEQRALEIAGNAYLFGDSRRVTEYRPVLESYRAPFMASVYAARRVHILPGATLVVDGQPAILLFEDVVLHDGGRLITHTPTNAVFGRLRKIKGERS